jgi:hypothetical protein
MKRLLAALAAVAPLACLALTAGAPAAGSLCPSQLLPLGTNPVSPAIAAALARDSAKNKPQVTGAMIAATDPSRGDQVKRDCGTQAWRRTVIVYITDRAFLPSASLSERVMFVGRTGAGFRVWQVAH